MSLAHAFNAFGTRLLRELSPNRNCFVSPLSLAVALSAVLAGARGRSAQELAGLLGVDAAGLPGRLSELVQSLLSRRENTLDWDAETGESREVEQEVFRLHLANAAFVQREFPLRPDYLDLIQKQLLADLHSLDFGAPETAAAQINRWVADQTAGRIANLVSPDAIGPLTRLVLANAVYFMAHWQTPFEASLTGPRPFHPLEESGAEPTAIDMMRGCRWLPYACDEALGLEAVQVPYRGELSMLVILPRPGRFHDVAAALDAPLLERLADTREGGEVELELPRFELSYGAELAELLGRLGAPSLFDADACDLGGITDHPDGLVVSEVVHQARLRVDENATEAAAATAMTCALGAIEEEEVAPIPFCVDRPFLLAIWDPRTRCAVFVGRCVELGAPDA